MNLRFLLIFVLSAPLGCGPPRLSDERSLTLEIGEWIGLMMARLSLTSRRISLITSPSVGSVLTISDVAREAVEPTDGMKDQSMSQSRLYHWLHKLG